MATIIKSTPKEDAWTWQNGDYVDGETVRCINHQFKESNRSFVSGAIDPHQDHGWTTATSDYYYIILSGEGVVYLSKNDRFSDDKVVEIKAGESFMIPAGTTYNYRAGASGLTFILFMNNLWEE